MAMLFLFNKDTMNGGVAVDQKRVVKELQLLKV
jgi:hypothetical protein